MAVTVCLTCIKSIGAEESCLTISDSKEAQVALSKHFWFGEDQCLKSIICEPCWHKIDEFYRFYCEVEQLHAQQMFPPVNLVEIKQESDVSHLTPELEDSEKLVQLQIQPANAEISEHQSDDEEHGYEDHDDNDNDDDDDEGDYKPSKDSDENISSDDDEDDKPLATLKRKRTRRSYRANINVEQVEQYIRDNIKLECTDCSAKSDTFEELQGHTMEEHKTRAYVICCEQKFINVHRLNGHVQVHLNPDTFKCSHCSKQCPNKEALRKHTLKVHTTEEEKKYHCKICPRKFTKRSALVLHEKNHRETDPKEDGRKPRKRHHQNQTKRDIDNEKMISDNANLECDSCQKKYDTFVLLQKHSMAEHKRLAYVFCCGMKFNKKPRLIDHVRFHLDPTKFQCKICSKNFPHTISLNRHMDRMHTPADAKTLQCSMCPKMFSHQRLLNSHINFHNRSWQCDICDRKFICEAVLRQHHQSVHTKELSFVCHVCAKTFNIYSSYRSHVLAHSDSGKPPKPRKLVQCPVCGTMTQWLSHHIRQHSGTKTCELCGEVCKNLISYRLHKKRHETGDFVCSVCSKTFKKNISLKEHMASHTGDILYSCDFCDRTFNSNANKASHRKKMHPEQWLEDQLKKKAARQQAQQAAQAERENDV